MNPEFFSKQIKRFYAASPITSIQMGAGLGLHFATVLVAPAHFLFHPKLIQQFYRIPTSLLMLSTQTWDAAQKAFQLFYYQAPMESAMNEMDKNMFLETQLVIAAMVVGMELLFFSKSNIIRQGRSVIVTPYLLYPILEQANRWLWAMTTHPSNVTNVFGFALQPLHVTLIMSFAGGWHSLLNSVKGLAISLLCAQTLSLKRWNGEQCVNWLQTQALEAYQFLLDLQTKPAAP
ncbi:hypothetical protein EDD86DRAFT_201808, partial [Gorgonomyces haynaldii]